VTSASAGTASDRFMTASASKRDVFGLCSGELVRAKPPGLEKRLLTWWIRMDNFKMNGVPELFSAFEECHGENSSQMSIPQPL
jgi:hypothetical protein